MQKREKLRSVRDIGRLSITVREASQQTGISIRQLYVYLSTGTIESVKLGSRRLILWDSLERLVLGAKGEWSSIRDGGRLRRQRRSARGMSEAPAEETAATRPEVETATAE